jgi:AcrR family transcriptional regulator
VANEATTRERILEACYACIARHGFARTTVEDVAREAGLSRATLYRAFPGGRDDLLRETVVWEMGRFFGRLAEAVAGAPDFATLVEEGLRFARAAILEHQVLQTVLVTEPEMLLPLMTVETERPLRFVVGYLEPFLEREQRAGRLRSGVEVADAAEYTGRLLLSLIGSPGRWDLTDPSEVRLLVREQLLAPVLTPEALAAT